MELKRQYSKKEVDKITNEVIKCAIEVHKILGPGLHEKIYEDCMMIELALRNIKATRQINCTLDFKGHQINTELRLDILVEDIISVELKAKESIPSVEVAILLSYMEMLKSPKGIMINFHSTKIIGEGAKTYVNKYYSYLSDL